MSIEREEHVEKGQWLYREEHAEKDQWLYILRCDLCREVMWRQEGSLPRPPHLCIHCTGTPEGLALAEEAARQQAVGPLTAS